MIVINNLTMRFGSDCVLDDVCARIDPGEVVSIIGPSGSGKSTLLRCINGLETPAAGQIFIDGENILAPGADIPRIRRKTGMVFQAFNLFEHMSVLDNLTVGPVRILKESRTDAAARAHELLRMVGLGDKALCLPRQLSGGQKQRVAIARCLSMRPKVILFDEPTSALDPTMVSEVLAVIRTLTRQGLTMLIVTHELNFAKDVSSRVFYMDEHRIYESGTPEQILLSPQKDKTRTFIHRLRSWRYHIEDRNFDVFAMNAEIESFGEKHFFSRRMTQHIQLAIEESLALYFANPGAGSLDIMLSFSEKDGSVQIQLLEQQLSSNFLEQPHADDLSRTILNGIVSNISWQSTPAGNQLSMTLIQNA